MEPAIISARSCQRHPTEDGAVLLLSRRRAGPTQAQFISATVILKEINRLYHKQYITQT